MKKIVFTALFLGLLAGSVYAENNLLIKPEDLRLVPSENGYDLYVRKLKNLESIMLTETTKDPEGKNDNYAYRAMEYNPVNGDEVRYLNGKVLVSEYSKFSLIDSSAEKDDVFGEAFHIFIPNKIQYGYPWSRSGQIEIGRGTFINIRAFSKKYGDYSGEFYDNPYMFDLGKRIVKEKQPVVEEKIEVLTDDYNPVASEKFAEISQMLIYSRGPETIVNDIMNSLMAISPKDKADVVFVIDATGSMKDDIEMLRKEWVPRLLEACKEFGSLRLGLLLYRDYGDSYKYRNLPVRFFDFTTDIGLFTRNLNSFTIKGNEGGDIPEAVYEALYAGLEYYTWDEEAVRKIILIGDAEPHPYPRGTKKYTKDLVMMTAHEKNIHIDAIITPDDKGRRGR